MQLSLRPRSARRPSLKHFSQSPSEYTRIDEYHADFSARLAGLQVGSAQSEPSGDFGLIGLAVMGQNLILNAADHGFTVVAFNRTVSKVDRFLENEAKGMMERPYLRTPGSKGS